MQASECGMTVATEELKLTLVRKHDRTGFTLGPAEPGRLVEALGAPVVLARNHKRVVGTSLTRDPHGFGNEFPAVSLTPLARYDVELGQVGLLRRAPHRRLNPHHCDPDSRAGRTLAGEQNRDAVAPDQFGQSGGQLGGVGAGSSYSTLKS